MTTEFFTDVLNSDFRFRARLLAIPGWSSDFIYIYKFSWLYRLFIALGV